MSRGWIYLFASLSAIVMILSSVPVYLSEKSPETQEKPTPIGVKLHFYTIINSRVYPINGAIVILQDLTPPFTKRIFRTDEGGDSPTLLYIPLGIYKYILIWQMYPLFAIGKIRIKIKDSFSIIDVYVPINPTSNQKSYQENQHIKHKNKISGADVFAPVTKKLIRIITKILQNSL